MDTLYSGTWQCGEGTMYRPTWVEIDRAAFLQNWRAIGRRAGKSVKLLAVVKANAYGHMAAPLAQIAQKEGAAMLGVSSIEEGVSLRENGITGDILIMGSLYPFENFAVAARHRLTPTISSLRGLVELVRAGNRLGTVIPFHLKIDAGMGRVGVSAQNAAAILERIAKRRDVRMTGMYMHFSAADCDKPFTEAQLRQFTGAVRLARRLGLKFTAHADNSSAFLKSAKTHFDMIRPGIILYGLLPYAGAGKVMKLEPVLSWKTRVVFLKKVPRGTCISYGRTFVTRRASLIATLPVGYADGYDRALSNRGEVLVRGRRCPIIGRVTMDMTMVDVTDVKGISIGDEVVLIGRQGAEQLSAEDMADRLGTINYEVTCAISSRVPRILK